MDLMNRSPGPITTAATPSTDVEHQIQMGLAHAFHEAVRADQDAALARQILDQLLAYSDVHFMSEQLLMRLCGYPEYDDHLLDHDRMMERLVEVKHRHEIGDRIDALREAEALQSFLARHIETRDRRFGDYYHAWARNIAPSDASHLPAQGDFRQSPD
jgi:hemerythrin-like metal-binding protein